MRSLKMLATASMMQSQKQLDRVNEETILEALKILKINKHDELFTIASDCLVNGPPELVTHLTTLIKLFLSHGSVPLFLILCTLMPLVKDNLADITASENYRAIAGGSLLLKLLDIVILLLEGDTLGFDQMQFAYQAKASTTMCSWTATAVIEHFNRNGSAVYGAAMDMSKAFDLVEWSDLFQTLMSRNMEPIFLRLMLFIYKNQKCDVKWCEQHSVRISVTNGVRQGSVSSAMLFTFRGWIGCQIDGVLFGTVDFADDEMTCCCQPENQISHKPSVSSVSERMTALISNLCSSMVISLMGQQVKHLGILLQSDNSMSVDIAQKRGKYIGKVNSLFQEFHFA